ncbi:alpha/beta fold hydrolase [Streptomyces sp. NPDC127036]|uniref:thioesterase domain-containing protein n=1 Tax=Streptomyces sp. NPDC127036 TaxID=3347112 RepID=UPI003647A69C
MNRGNLLALRQGSSDHTMVFVHPAGGSAGGFRQLLAHLDPIWTVLAYEAIEPGPSDRCSVPAIAEDYLEELTATVSPAGVVLVGWSFGGAVAVEMARLAEASAHPPKAVILLDSSTPNVLAQEERTPAAEMAALFGVDVTVADGKETTALDAAAAAINQASPGAGISAQELRPFLEIFHWHLDAARHPWPGLPCAAPTFLVRAADEEGWHEERTDLGWSAVFGEHLYRRSTPGTHHSLIAAENAPALAHLLQETVAALPRRREGQPTTDFSRMRST